MPEETKTEIDPIEKAKQELKRDWTMLCAELGNKIYADHVNSKIEASNKKEQIDILSRMESIQEKNRTLLANEPKKTEETPDGAA